MPILSVILYNLFNSSEICSNALAIIDLKYSLRSEDKPKREFGKITYYKFDVLSLRKYSEFTKASY